MAALWWQPLKKISTGLNSCFHRIKPTLIGHQRWKASTEQDLEDLPPVELAMPDTAEEAESALAAAEEALERQRNKSRLQVAHQRLVNGLIPYPEPKTWFHCTVKYRQKIYARYGQESGINPGIMWPTREELEKIKEYEALAHPFTLQEMVQAAKNKREEEAAYRKRREEEVHRNMGKLEQWKQELVKRTEKKLAETQRAQEKKERLMEEVRRHFGYKVDTRDQRFKDLLEKKEKEEKKILKEARKKEYQTKLLTQMEKVQEEMGGNK